MKTKVFIFFILIFSMSNSIAQESYRPGLFFREDWKETPPEIPLSQNHVNNPELLVQLYGAGKDSLKKSNHDRPVDDPFYVWSACVWKLAGFAETQRKQCGFNRICQNQVAFETGRIEGAPYSPETGKRKLAGERRF
jgi:hypothetical protein